MNKTLGIIPARIGSTRLPKKPLVDIKGKSLIKNVYDSCFKSKLINDIIVATDSNEIYDHVKSFGGNVCMTNPEHNSGTSRVIEVIQNNSGFDNYLNIQGDSIGIDSEHIDSLIIKMECLKDEEFVIVTPIVKFIDLKEIDNKNVVKVVLSMDNSALYFSRSKIPYLRDENLESFSVKYGWKHLGLYGFNKNAISKIETFNISYLEQGELLEQLTWLYNGLKIHCVQVGNDLISIDTEEDLKKARSGI